MESIPRKLFNLFSSLSPPTCLSLLPVVKLDNVVRQVNCPSPCGIYLNSGQLNISRCLRLIIFPMSLGNFTSLLQQSKSSVCKICNLATKLASATDLATSCIRSCILQLSILPKSSSFAS
ncbi:Uncharacterized protein TCM_043245 [Theobroma cacao]|uniref:Uncharacterized protein n=1 Tax=Theobroma cacao TaxID=3641 RepID=A0A061FNV7_THECC|nr:Uncharacterized protein TCM_043245 [Theobroma cacao]